MDPPVAPQYLHKSRKIPSLKGVPPAYEYMDASDEQAIETVMSAMELLGEDSKDWALPIREEELHALVRAHENLDRVVHAIEEELQYRVENGDKLAAGDDGDREYAERNGQEVY